MNLFCLLGAVSAGRARSPGCCGRSCGVSPRRAARRGHSCPVGSGEHRGGKGSQIGAARPRRARRSGAEQQRGERRSPARTAHPEPHGTPRRGREGSGEAQRGPGLCLAVPARPGRSRSRGPHGALTGGGRGRDRKGRGGAGASGGGGAGPAWIR